MDKSFLKLFEVARRSIVGMLWGTKWFLGLLCLVFIMDAMLFYCFRLTVNPINEEILELFFPPKDIFVPEVTMTLSEGVMSYEFSYTHRYSGRHVIELCMIPHENHSEKYVPKFPGLRFSIEIKSSNGTTVSSTYLCDRPYCYYEHETPNRLPLCRCEEMGGRIFKCENKIRILIDGDISDLLRLHSKCYFQVKNDTHL